MEIKSLSKSQEKWKERAQAATPAYSDGVSDPKVRWAGPAAGAAIAYAEGVQRAISLDLFAKGVTACGDAKWQAAAISKGVPRYGQGIRASGSSYSAGFAPYHSALSALELPPRYARRDERNLERFHAVVQAMISVKEAQLA